MNIYVGNLAREVTDDDLREAFGAFGQVASARVIVDRYSGQSRGFGFVEMESRSEATAAIAGLNGKELNWRSLIVNEARPPTERRDAGRRRPRW
jgi:RNA recognition motif-containing protein